VSCCDWLIDQPVDCCFVAIGHQVIPQSFAAAAKKRSPRSAIDLV